MRDLLKRYRNLFLAVALLLSILLLYSYNLRQRTATTFFERAVLTFAAPFQAAIDGAADVVNDWWQHYFWLVQTEQRNSMLEQENRQLRAELQQVEEFRLQNERLRQLLAFVDDLDRPALPAQVIGEDVSSWARTITIDKGTRAGLRAGFPVVAAEGVVGRVIKVAPNSSRVLLVTDASSAIAALVQRTRTRGVARGQGAKLTLDYALREADIQIDDLLVTSGMGGVFPKGLPLARVVSAEKDEFGLFQRVELVPTVDFSHLEEVMVVLGEDR
ncbi:rod shape-determining protein MreC [Malonomonas rubra DSM 5091]|uniref:Cell shape-determining protein MreC n=1 Tax=Malonomonas rubra DSM 5091 TaxID=1122189 RepID=A0A1M6C112_MALRU|nr:rod shape-determining protein MreC [Malonomonas rubra]SHI54729.1 rod shape-determining protein MreC [Malonomonas rubra DSM 5091]